MEDHVAPPGGITTPEKKSETVPQKTPSANTNKYLHAQKKEQSVLSTHLKHGLGSCVDDALARLLHSIEETHIVGCDLKQYVSALVLQLPYRRRS